MATYNGAEPKRWHGKWFEREVRKRYLLPLLRYAMAEAQRKGLDLPLREIVRNVDVAINEFIDSQDPGEILTIALTWATMVNKYNEKAIVRDFVRVASVDVRPALARGGPLNDALKRSVERSVKLIKTIPARHNEEVRKRLTEDYILGEMESPNDLFEREKIVRRELKRANKTTGYNLRRITRDQSNKLNGDLTQARHEMAGVTRYRWSTSLDDRVRPTHVSKHGDIFFWNAPPPDTGHPGNDIQCRCVAIPDITPEELKAKLGVG